MKKTQYQRAREEILNAIENGVEELELIGPYNYDHLSKIIRGIGIELWEDEYIRAMEAYGYKHGYLRLSETYIRMLEHGYTKYVRCHQERYGGRNHVFCIIHSNAPKETAEAIIKDVKEEIFQVWEPGRKKRA